MSQMIPLVMSLDGTQAKAEIRDINRAIEGLGKVKTKSPLGFDKRHVAQLEKQLKASNTRIIANRQRVLEAIKTTHKKEVDSHKAALRQIETGHKASLRAREAATKRATAKEIQSAKKIAERKKHERRLFEQQERAKSKQAELEARRRTIIIQHNLREQAKAKQREFQAFQRIERQKTVEANQRARNRAQLGTNIQSAGQSVTRIGRATTLAVTVPIVAATAAILKMGAEYETSMNIFQATTQATEDVMERAGKKAIELGNDLTLPGVSAADAGEAMTALAKNAFSADQAIDASLGTLRLAKAVNLDAAMSAEVMAAAINTFGLEAKDSTKIADLYAASANASASTTSDMAEAMKNAGSVMANSNQSIEDTVALISILANAGIRGGDAGTGLKAVMLSLTAPSSKAAKAIKQIGLNVFDAEGKTKKLSMIFKELNERTANLTDEQKLPLLKAIFGKIGIKTALPLLAKGNKEFERMHKAVTRANAAQELSAARTKGLAGAWEAMVSTLETVGLQIFEFIKVPVTQLLFFLANSINTIAEMFGKLPKGIKVIATAIVGLVAAIGPLLVVIGTVITLVGAVMATITAAGGIVVILKGIGIGVLVLTGLLIQMTPVIIGVTAAIATAVAAWQSDFGGFRTFTIEVFNQIWSVIETVYTAIRDLTIEIGGEVVKWWNDNYPLIEEAVSRVSNSIKLIVGAFIQQVQAFWEEHGEWITSTVSVMWDRVKGIITTAVKLIGDIIKFALQLINKDWEGAWETLLNIIRRGNELAIRIHYHLLASIGNILLKIIATTISWGIRFVSVMVGWATKAVIGVVYIIATLPQQLIAIVPKLIAAGIAIGQAIWEGVKQGLTGASGGGASGGLSFDTGARASGSLSGLSPSRLSLPRIGGLPRGGGFGGGGGRRSGGGRGGRGGSGGRSGTPRLSKIQELRKAATDARKEVDFLNSSLEVVDLKTRIIKSNELKSLAEELIKLREQVGANPSVLPVTEAGLKKQIDLIKESISIADDANDLQEEMKDAIFDVRDANTFAEKAQRLINRAVKNGTDEFNNQKDKIMLNNAALADAAIEKKKLFELESQMVDRGNETIANLTKELELFGKTDEVEKLLIENKFELLALRQSMLADGFSEASVKHAEAELGATQKQIIELTKKIELKKKERDLQLEIERANNFGKDLIDELQGLKNFNKEMTTYEKTLRKVNEDYQNISPAHKAYILDVAKQIDAQKVFNEEVLRTEDFLRNTFDILLDSGRSFSDKLKDIFGGILDSFKTMLSDMLTAWITSKLFGVSSGSGGSASGGQGGGASGILGSIFNKIFKPSGGGGINIGGGPGGTPTFNSSGGSGIGSGLNIASDIRQVSHSLTQELKSGSLEITSGGLVLSGATEPTLSSSGGIGQATGGLSGLNFGQFGKSLGQMAPLLGLSLGGLVGGQSGVGQLLGGAGGLLGGLVLGASTGAIGGSLGGLFALSGVLGPAALIAAPLLLLGGFLLGRNKQRRADERTRNQLSLDSFAQIDQLIKDVNLDRIDGQSALAQANGIRENYLKVAGGLKDKKTRKIALKDVSRVDSRIATLRSAVSAQEHRQDVGKQLVPEFASGGVFNTATGNISRFNKRLPRNFSGKVPGSFDGQDDVLLAVSKGEHVAVFNPSQQLDFAPTNQSGGGGDVVVVIDQLVLEVDAGVNSELVMMEGLKVKSVENLVVNKTLTRLKDG